VGRKRRRKVKSFSNETVRYRLKFCGIRTQEWQRWRDTVEIALVNYRPVLSPGRAPHKKKTEKYMTVLNIWSWAPGGCPIPRYTGRLTDWPTELSSFLVQVYRGLKSCTSLIENVSLRVPPSSLREFSLFCACPANKHCPSARWALLSTWRRVKIFTFLHLEAFLLIAFMLLIVDRICYYYAIISSIITLICTIIIFISLII
jgi:hypothetical protein